MEKFGAILCDPPWKFVPYGDKGITGRSPDAHYSTMTVDELCALPVSDWAAKDCVLFMWVVDAHFLESLKIIEAWGFTLKTIGLNWLKTTKDGRPKMSMGYWTRKESEICFLATRGKPSRVGKGVRQVIMSPPREHSRKPDEQYERIEALVNGPYLEMFARQQWPGWSSWGNETGKFIPARSKPAPSQLDIEDFLGSLEPKIDMEDLIG